MDAGLDIVTARALGLKMPSLDLVIVGCMFWASIEVTVGDGNGSTKGDAGIKDDGGDWDVEERDLGTCGWGVGVGDGTYAVETVGLTLGVRIGLTLRVRVGLTLGGTTGCEELSIEKWERKDNQ